MTIIRNLVHLPLARWLRKRSKGPVWGPVVRLVWRLREWHKINLIRMRSQNRAHDRRQAAILEKFESDWR